MEFDKWNKKMWDGDVESIDLSYADIFKILNALEAHFSREFEMEKSMLIPDDDKPQKERAKQFETFSQFFLAKTKKWDETLDKLLPYNVDEKYDRHYYPRAKEVIEDYKKYV